MKQSLAYKKYSKYLVHDGRRKEKGEGGRGKGRKAKKEGKRKEENGRRGEGREEGRN